MKNMSKVDFIKLAEHCVTKIKLSLEAGKDEIYLGTLFVAIQDDDRVFCSKTWHILEYATKCILIHSYTKKAVTNWYKWFFLEYIDENGSITNGFLGNGFRLFTDWGRAWSDQRIILEHDNLQIYSLPAPFEDKMQKIWNLFLKVREAESNAEIKLLSEIIWKDDKILEQENEIASLNFTNKLLEKQKEQYEHLLGEIKELINCKEEV
jgi:hypothetical protein